jgi:hypothetical protein
VILSVKPGRMFDFGGRREVTTTFNTIEQNLEKCLVCSKIVLAFRISLSMSLVGGTGAWKIIITMNRC